MSVLSRFKAFVQTEQEIGGRGRLIREVQFVNEWARLESAIGSRRNSLGLRRPSFPAFRLQLGFVNIRYSCLDLCFFENIDPAKRDAAPGIVRAENGWDDRPPYDQTARLTFHPPITTTMQEPR